MSSRVRGLFIGGNTYAALYLKGFKKDAEEDLQEADNLPASSCRAPLPAGGRQTPGMTQLGKNNKKTRTGSQY